MNSTNTKAKAGDVSLSLSEFWMHFCGWVKREGACLCVSECIRSANRGAEELRNCSGLLSCGRLALALLSVGSSGSLRSRPRWFGFSAAILSSQFSILRFSPLSAARFSSLDSRIVLALQFCSFAVAALPASLPALLRISNVVYQCFCCLFVVDAGRGVRILYLFSTHTLLHLPYASSSPPNNKN